MEIAQSDGDLNAAVELVIKCALVQAIDGHVEQWNHFTGESHKLAVELVVVLVKVSAIEVKK